MLALVPPANESPRSLNDPSSNSKRGKYLLSPKYCVVAAGKPSEAGSKIPWCWRMLGSWNRDQLARMFSSDDGDMFQTWSTLTASLMRKRKLPVGRMPLTSSVQLPRFSTRLLRE